MLLFAQGHDVLEVVDVPVLELRRCRGGPKDAGCQPPPGVATGLPVRLGGWGSRGRSRRLALSDPPSVLPKRTKAGGHVQVY